MKVTGGVKRLTQEPTALYRYCLIAPSLNDISKVFYKKHNIEPTGREDHYQLSGSTYTRIVKKVEKVLESLDNFGVDFKEESCVFNIVTKAVLPESSAAELLTHRSIGQDLYELFPKERIKEEASLWSTIKKRNLKTFWEVAKSIMKKKGEKAIQLKEERTLLSRFLIAARKWTELDLEETIGNYEFSVVPKLMFGQNGEPLLSSNEAKILHAIGSSSSEEKDVNTPLLTEPVIILDGMALVNKAHKDEEVKTWKVFSSFLPECWM